MPEEGMGELEEQEEQVSWEIAQTWKPYAQTRIFQKISCRGWEAEGGHQHVLLLHVLHWSLLYTFCQHRHSMLVGCGDWLWRFGGNPSKSAMSAAFGKSTNESIYIIDSIVMKWLKWSIHVKSPMPWIAIPRMNSYELKIGKAGTSNDSHQFSREYFTTRNLAST